jgi:hypothetical protein
MKANRMQKPMAKLARKEGFLRCMSQAEKCEFALGPVQVMPGVRSTVK